MMQRITWVALVLLFWQLTLAAAQLATVYTSCTKDNVAALTFDDGPYIYEPEVVNTLNDAGIKGTFFVNGNNYGCIYDSDKVASLRNAFGAGHEFGSHTWDHRDLATLSSSEIQSELARTELALRRILGVQPALMRPPYGSYNDEVRRVSAMRNQSLVLWDFDSGDSTGSTAAQSKAGYTGLANRRPNSVLALNHETIPTTANDVLPFAITTLRNAGYQFVTVSECLGTEPYQFTTGPQSRTAAWNCN